MAPPHYFETQAGAPTAYRIAGGSIALIKKLGEVLENYIITKTKVESFTATSNGIAIKTSKGDFEAKKVVVTIPPKLAATITFLPELPKERLSTLNRTHTWMSNAIKVGLLFKTPFWRKRNLSGTVIGQVGPVIELYDHCNATENRFALMGFANEGLRDVSQEQRKERILNYLANFLGSLSRFVPV